MLLHSTEVGNALEVSRKVVDELNDQNLQIAASTEQQDATTTEISVNIERNRDAQSVHRRSCR